MEDYAERMPGPRNDRAHTVTHVHPIESTRAADRAIPVGEDNPLASIKRDREAPRLSARALLDEQEFSALEVASVSVEHAGKLKRERDFAVQVLMQAVVAACLISED